jgi:predicted anti-sigma-YlaC factor YlaD
MHRRSITCDRVRLQLSLELDGGLSQFERPMLAVHLARCAECRAYRAEARAFTSLLRTAPLERLSEPVTAWRSRRRLLPARLPAVAGAALAFAVVGVGTQLMVAGRTHESTLRSSVRTVVTRFPSPAEIRQEMSLVERAMAGEAIATPSGSQVSKPK